MNNARQMFNKSTTAFGPLISVAFVIWGTGGQDNWNLRRRCSPYFLNVGTSASSRLLDEHIKAPQKQVPNTTEESTRPLTEYNTCTAVESTPLTEYTQQRSQHR